MKNNIVTIIGVIILVVVAGNFYQGCTRGNSEDHLNALIDNKEQEIDELKKGYAGIIEQEQMLLEQIGALKDRVTELRLDISEGETQLSEIKTELIDIDSAITIIQDHTSRSVSRGISLLTKERGGAGAGDN